MPTAERVSAQGRSTTHVTLDGELSVREVGADMPRSGVEHLQRTATRRAPTALAGVRLRWGVFDGRDIGEPILLLDEVHGYSVVTCPYCRTVRQGSLPYCCEFASDSQPPTPA